METCNVRRRSGVFIVNFEHIPHLVLVFLLLTWRRVGVFIVNFEHVIAGWACIWRLLVLQIRLRLFHLHIMFNFLKDRSLL